ncbi:MAG TPA: hypothetical protein PKC84_18655, partial [Paracoccaceae bacterium]|nr:hypothetical protein [Paracoccaceae bacterium]
MRSGLGQGLVRLTGLMPVHRANGRTDWYFRRKGQPLVRLPDLPHDHPDFLAAYAQARGAARPRKPAAGTIGAACAAALASREATAHSPAYRAMLARHIEAIRQAGQGALARDLRRRHIEADLQALTPAVAQGRLKAWRTLCRGAVAAGLMVEDPTQGIRRPALPPSEGHRAWSADDVARFRARWPVGTVARARFELLAWTGCRVGDAARIGPGMVGKDGVLAYRQAKTGGLAYVPWTCPLPDYATGMAADRQAVLAALA